MIICESLQTIQEISQQVGINCISVSLIDTLDLYFTRQSVIDLLVVQWGIYTMLLAYQWSYYGLKKHKI